MRADQDFADGLILRDRLGSIANHIAGVARSKVQSLHASTKPEIKRLVNDCNQSAVTADCNGLFKIDILLRLKAEES